MYSSFPSGKGMHYNLNLEIILDTENIFESGFILMDPSNASIFPSVS